MSSPTAVLSVIAEHVDRYHQEVGDLAPGIHPDDAELMSAVYEAERALRSAARLVRRAAKLSSQR